MSHSGRVLTFSIYLSCCQIRLTDSHRPPCETPRMDLDKMTTAEVESLLRLLADMEREELVLLIHGSGPPVGSGRVGLQFNIQAGLTCLP